MMNCAPQTICNSNMRTDHFDYDLPSELIAQYPVRQRTDSRMLYLDGTRNRLHDTVFAYLTDYLHSGDVIVFNDTRVLKARLYGRKDSGGKVEVMIERVIDDHHTQAAIRASHAPKTGNTLLLADCIPVTVLARRDDLYTLRFDHHQTVYDLLERYGHIPLPPYIDREDSVTDEARYQTIYAKNNGAVAAPTAGLHFDDMMLKRLQKMGVVIAYVTLHVGAGTFQPVRVENVADHTMHSERFNIPEETVNTLEQAKATGGRILAVGTTTLRALEASAALNGGQVVAGYGETNIFITPGYCFQVVERLLTNFHLPRSTLLMLVSAFGGMDNIRAAYQHAVSQQYRFFSYGDAMLIERNI